ncbi:MAG: nitroreductase family protein [archaeon]
MENIKNIFHYLIFKLKDKLDFSQDKKGLKYKLRTSVHGLEKSEPIEGRYLYKLLRAHDFYTQAKEKNLLTENDIEWCERVIYGKRSSRKVEHSLENLEEIDKIIRNRRSIRSYTDEPISEDDFEKLIDVAKWAPSACNRQPWNFILTKDKEKIKLLAEERGKWIEKAPSCIIVTIDFDAYGDIEKKYTPYLDAGSVIQTLLLKAEVMGYGACWVNFGEIEVDEDARKEINEAFSLPNGYKIVTIIPIGKYEDKPNAPGRKDRESMIHIEELIQ